MEATAILGVDGKSISGTNTRILLIGVIQDMCRFPKLLSFCDVTWR